MTERGQMCLAERTFYGETLSDGASSNLRGRIFRQLDGAGLVTHAYDFKGNVVRSSRRLGTKYDETVNWPDLPDPGSTTPDLQLPGLEGESFDTTTAYDALNRITRLQVPSGAKRADGTSLGDHVAVPTYNEAALLETMSVKFAGVAAAAPFVSDVDYNEKGQRKKIVYGNGVRTEYDYEPETFRLSMIKTFKTPSTTKPDLQGLSYTYDPVGNITTIKDEAQQTYFVGNSIVKPTTKYTYDAIYRLTNSLGREHSGQAVMDQTFTPAGVPIPSPNDPQAMQLYAQKYEYDEVGNFLRMAHAVPDALGQFQNLWTRTYTPDTKSNRLLGTVVGDASSSTAVTYVYDDAGNITNMQSGSLPTLEWDYRNRLTHVVSSRGDSYFTYDGAGQRVRKVLVPPPGQGPIHERIYLGAYEIYRERKPGSDTITLERRTLHVNDNKRRIALAELLAAGKPAKPGSINDGPAELIRYQLENHLGSATLELDGAARLLSYEEFHPYGTTAFRATDSVLSTTPKRYAFIAKERDEGTGLYYCEARHYAPWLGRWTSADPPGMVDGPNLYSYCHDNPVRLRDPSGMKDQEAFKPSVA